MSSKNEIIKAIAIGLCEVANPQADPREEVELRGLSPFLYPLARTEGTGLATRHFGARWIAHYQEAQKLYVVVDTMQKLTSEREP